MNLFEKMDTRLPEISAGLLLILNIFFIFIIPFFPVSWHVHLNTLLFSLIFLTSIFTIQGKRRLIFNIAVFALIAEWISYSFDLPVLNFISAFTNIAFFQFIVVRLIIQVAKSKKADVIVIIESINGYLMLGMIFTIWVAIAMMVNDEAFRFSDPVPTMRDYTYYSFITMTTVGYGDITPQLPFAKAIATFISTCGQIYLAVIIAMLVGKYAASQPN